MRLAIAILIGVAAPLAAQTPDAAPPPPAAAPAPPAAPKPATVLVVLQTSLGPITLEIEKERAPITAGNFLKYVDQKRLDGTGFYRAVKVQDDFGLIQGGPNNDPKRVLPRIAHEPTSTTGVHHTSGAISMARNAPGSAQGEFFITVGDQSTSMDADPAKPGDNLGFAAFGHVAAGMDLVRQILSAPTSPTAGPPGMKGQMLEPVVRILTARRTTVMPAAATPPPPAAPQ